MKQSRQEVIIQIGNAMADAEYATEVEDAGAMFTLLQLAYGKLEVAMDMLLDNNPKLASPLSLKTETVTQKLDTLADINIKTVIQEAQNIIYEDREKTYGHPTKNINNIAEQWTLYLQQKYNNGEDNNAFSISISAEDVCWMMVDLKKARQMNSGKRDNLVDAIGYIGLIERIG